MFVIKHLYKKIICVVAIIATTQISFAQNYIHSPNDTLIANAVFDDVGVFNINQLHPNNDTLFFRWKKWLVNIPTTWEASMCDVGHCYTSVVDSSTMDAVYPTDIGIMSLHLNPHFEAGTGIVQVLFWEQKTPTQIDTLTWVITANGALAIGTNEYKNAIQIFPNPSSNQLTISTNLENGFWYAIYDVLGNAIENGFSINDKIHLNTSYYLNGNYSLIISTDKNFQQIKFQINH